MNSRSATTNRAADQRLTRPLSAACAPELIAARIEVVLMPPRLDTKASRLSEPCISRRTSWRNDMNAYAARSRPPQSAHFGFDLEDRDPPHNPLTRCAAGDAAIQHDWMAR